MLSIDTKSQANVTTTLNNASQYLEDLLNLDNPFIDHLISSIYPKELNLDKLTTLILLQLLLK